MIKGIDKDHLRRYAEMRHKIDVDQELIYAISSILAMLKRLDDDRLLIDPTALGHVNKLMNNAVMNIWEELNNFIHIADAEMTLDELDGLSTKPVKADKKI